MRAAVLHGPGDLQIEDRPIPTPGVDEVVVEVSHCGVCGTDLHMVVEGWGTPGSIGGHEWSGTVVAAGAEVRHLAAGDRVVGGVTPACGACDPCHADRPSLCLERSQPGAGGPDGAFAGYVRMAACGVVRVPDGLDLRTAALAEPLAVSLHAVHRARTEPGHRVLVTGAGPIGALTIVALRAEGITDIVVSEPSPIRQDLARRLGAAQVVEPADLEVPSIAEPARIVDGAVDVAIECSGKASAMLAACAQLRRGGTLVLVGTGIEGPSFDPNRILLNELTVTGAFEYDAHGIDHAVELLASGAADVSELVEPTDIELADLLGAMTDLAAGRIAGKVLVDPGGRRP